MDWVGYKAHLTEICDKGRPRLITNVLTTHAAVSDDQVVGTIHQSLNQNDLLPEEHFMDGGYLSAEHLVNSESQYRIDVIGPVRNDHSWQAKLENGFDISHFKVNWDQKFVTCPQGHSSTKWHPDTDIHGKPVIKARFLGKKCLACPVRSQCTRAKTQPRELTFRPREQFVALNKRREIQQTAQFKKKYDQRAGIESTHSQGIRRAGLRQTRYIGLAKTHLQHVLTAIALNVIRVDAWLNDVPLAQTRISRFKQELQPLAA